MRLQDLHTHSFFDDGSDSLEQMVRAAIDRRLSAIGLSVHSPIEGQSEWTIRPDMLPDFMSESSRLKKTYGDRITVYCGIEYDVRSRLDLSGFDYVIGSLHSTASPAGSFDVDNTAEIAKSGIEVFFHGDADRAAEAYFAQYQAIAGNPAIHIVGHFDLLTKYDEQIGLYDARSNRFLESAFAAMEMLVKSDKIFELNSGAISRGWRKSPYPAENLLRRLQEINGKILLSSDAHSAGGVGYFFPEMLSLAKECGFTEIWQLKKGKFVPVPIRLFQV